MFSQLKTAISSLLVLTALTGIAYPLLVTGIAAVAFPKEASGSLITRDGKVIGSSLIGQEFTEAKYFWGRLSATTSAYNAAASSGSNLGPSNPALVDNAKARVDALRAADPTATGQIPIDLVTSSGSGLDPHISPAAALFQAPRVSRVRGIDEQKVRTLIADHTESRTAGLLGEPRVNVLLLNLALDQL